MNGSLLGLSRLLLIVTGISLTACAPVNRVSVGFGHDVNTVPEIHSKGARKGLGEFTYRAAFVNPVIRFNSILDSETFAIKPVVEFEITDRDSSYAGIGGDFVYRAFEHGEFNILGSVGQYKSDLTTGGIENFVENISFGFQAGYSHEIDENVWMGLQYNHISDAEIGEFNNATRDGFMLTVGYGF